MGRRFGSANPLRRSLPSVPVSFPESLRSCPPVSFPESLRSCPPESPTNVANVPASVEVISMR